MSSIRRLADVKPLNCIGAIHVKRDSLHDLRLLRRTQGHRQGNHGGRINSMALLRYFGPYLLRVALVFSSRVLSKSQSNRADPSHVSHGSKVSRENLSEKLIVSAEPARRPSKAAHSAGKSLSRLVRRLFK